MTVGRDAGPSAADRLRAARQRGFVGRVPERSLFAEALSASPPPFTVLWFHGPGGIGKSTLLRRCADDAAAAGRAVVLVDARSGDPRTPGEVAAGPAAGAGPAADRPPVLLLDTGELVPELERRLLDELVPTLPAGALVVVASRLPPGERWRADLGWQEELRCVALRNFEPEESVAYLHDRRLPPAVHGPALEFTHGHPLALALLADVVSQRGPDAAAEAGLSREELTDVVPALLERFAADVPDEAAARALRVLVHARVTTEGLLREVLGPTDAARCFAWLCGLSIAHVVPEGLCPHDVARQVLDADLRWRDPDDWLAMHRAIRRCYVDRLSTTPRGPAAIAAVSDLIYLHRHSEALRPYFTFDAVLPLHAEPAGEADLPDVLELVRRHEGEAAAVVTERWFRRGQGLAAIRGGGHRLAGFGLLLRLTDAAEAHAVGDPVAAAGMEYIASRAPLRPGEHVAIGRSFSGVDAYQEPGMEQQVFAGMCTAEWVGHPRPAVGLSYVARPEVWAPMFAHIDHARAEGADGELDGHRYAAYVHDWRVLPVPEWLELMEPRELAADERAAELAQRHVSAESLVMLSRPAFDAAVREALHRALHPADLARSPLLRSRVLRDAAGPRAGPDGLRPLLERAVAGVAADHRHAHLARCVTLTYLTAPGTTQQAVAARLSLPFSTYRRHLGRGVELVCDALWRDELGGPEDGQNRK